MSTLKVIEFRPQGPGHFTKFLQFLSQKKSWNWEFEVHPKFSMDLLTPEVAGAKVAPELSKEILPQLKVLPTKVRSVECLDSFFPEDGSWYPRLFLQEAIRSVLVSQARDLDIRMPAFIVGESDEARVVGAVLAEMGISDIYLIGDEQGLRPHKDILERSQLGIHFHVLPPEELTVQAVSAGIVVNTLDLTDNKPLLTDLSYFNFMKPQGYAMDLNLLPQENLLLEEAKKAELRVLPPILIAIELTRFWLERLNVSLSIQEIQEVWTEFLKE